jgi:hypothetical protein
VPEVAFGKTGNPVAEFNNEVIAFKFGSVEVDVDIVGFGKIFTGVDFLSPLEALAFVVLDDDDATEVLFAVPFDSIGNCNAVNKASGLDKFGRVGVFSGVFTFDTGVEFVAGANVEFTVLVLPTLAYFFLFDDVDVEVVLVDGVTLF